MKNKLLLTTAIMAFATTAAQAASVKADSLSLEVAGGYQFAARDFQKSPLVSDGSKIFRSDYSMPQVNLFTADLTGVYNLSDSQALTLRTGFGAGDDSIGGDEDRAYVKDQVEVFTLMPGYRYSMPVYGNNLKAFAGVNVGVAHVKYKSEQSGAPDAYYNTKVHDSAWGFAYSAEIGLRYELTEKAGIFAAYQFSGNTAKIVRHSYNHGLGNSHTDNDTQKQFYNGARIGLSYNF